MNMNPASKPDAPTLGVVVICRNEEKDLPGLLENLLHWVDQIVVVDDCSTDRTPDIAKAAGGHVTLLHHPMSDDCGFAGQRNAGIEACSCDWVLNMDADERVPQELAQEIRQAIADAALNAFRYRRLNFFLHRPMRYGGWTSWNHPQLARRGHHAYEGTVHEQCVVDGGDAAIGQLQHQMWHLNDESYAERMRKSFQYCRLEADRMKQAGCCITAMALFFRPMRVFLIKYAVKQGFRDGVPGLIAAIHAACAEFRACALVWDEQNRIPRQRVEAGLGDKTDDFQERRPATHVR